MLLGLLLLACGGPETTSAPKRVPGTGSGPAAADGAPSLPTLALPTEPASVACDPCELLLEHDYADLRAGKACELCGGDACERWPAEDPVPCEWMDRMRNCIYARLGYDFDTAPEWRHEFEKEPWYEVDPNFEWSRVTPVQKKNADQLRERVRRRRCEP